MFSYKKRLQYPVNIKKKDLRMAKYIITQFGGSNGELAAALRYYSQKYQLASYVNYYMNEIGDDGLVTVKEVTNDLGKVFARLSAPLTEVLNLSNIE